MQIDSRNRTISLFIGNLHIPLDTTLLQVDYDDFHTRVRALQESVAPQHLLEIAQQPDDPASIRSPQTPLPGSDSWDLATPHGALRASSLPPLLPGKVPVAHLPPAAAHEPGGGAGADLPERIDVSYRSGGDQMDMRVVQVNSLRSDDVVGTTDGSSLASPAHHVANLQTLETVAADQTPAHFVGAHDTPEAVIATLQDISPTGDVVAPAVHTTNSDYSIDHVTATLQPGLFIDGRPVDPDSALPQNPDTIVPAMPTDTHTNMAVVDAGGNVQSNAGELLNEHGPTGTLIVLGDSFKSNAIVQTNILVDHSVVAGTADSATIQAGDNAANNVASFVNTLDQNPYAMGLFGGLHWHVDTVSGNFYDVKLGTQFNYMTDNDLVSQTATDHYKFIETGANEQGNQLVETNVSASQYDLVVVGGSYYSANWLFQTNVLVNSDYVSVNGTAGGTGHETVSTGANWLLNSAVIVDYSTGSHPLTPELQAIASALQGGEQTLDLGAGLAVPGNGSMDLNVLFVTGNYYDFNVLQQTNVMSDSDTVVQNLGANESGYISTGGNQLSNNAAIVDVRSAAHSWAAPSTPNRCWCRPTSSASPPIFRPDRRASS